MSITDIALYVVATPIGNMADMTARAVEVLRSVDVIAAEDTRHSGRLLQHFAIATPMLSYHEHNEREASAGILKLLAEGKSVALIADAGTPLISDPGYALVRAAHRAGFRVVPVPGASALIAALSVAGLPTDRFVFEGFLPAKAAARQQRLAELATETRTLVFYESSHRIGASLGDLVTQFGADREITMAREISKVFETIRATTVGELKQFVDAHSQQQKGEFVLVVAGASVTAETAAAERTLALLVAELPLKQAVALTSRLTGASKNWLYEKALKLREGE